MWTDGNGYFHEGDCQAGERAATADEILAYRQSQITLETVQVECQRRIDAAVGLNAKLNMLGVTGANAQAVSILGQTATDEQKQTATLFIQAMQWIGAMKAACAGLVGNVDYDQDDNWPDPSAELLAFAAQF